MAFRRTGIGLERKDMPNVISYKQQKRILEATKVSEELALADAYYFILKYCKTLDPHESSTALVGRPFPSKKYIEELVSLWYANRVMVMVKSRKMMISWVFAALGLFRALQGGRFVGMMSRKEEEADKNLLGRIWYIYERLPRRIQWGLCKNQDTTRAAPAERTYCHIRFPWIQSEIIGLPQGADSVRPYVFSDFLADEFAHNEEQEETFTALMPTLEGGDSKAAFVFTPNGRNFAYKLVQGEADLKSSIEALSFSGG